MAICWQTINQILILYLLPKKILHFDSLYIYIYILLVTDDILNAM